MNADDLTAEQCDALREQIGPHRLYFHKLELRMYARGWDRDDETFENVRKAYAAMDSRRCRARGRTAWRHHRARE